MPRCERVCAICKQVHSRGRSLHIVAMCCLAHIMSACERIIFMTIRFRRRRTPTMQATPDARSHTVAKRIRIDRGVALKSFRSVISAETIAEINDAIDRSFGDVPQRSQSGAMVAAMLRRDDAFRQLE